MLTLDKFSEYLNNFMFFDAKLNVEKIDPYMTNGLMVRGIENIENIGFGVSASVEFFKKAKENNCQAVIVHHSFNLPKNHNYDEIFQNRIAYLIKNEISLFGFHFLLDAHPEIGNNISILKTIGAKLTSPYLHHGDPWGYSGELETEKNIDEIKKILSPFLSGRAVFYDFGNKEIKRVVALSGKGAPSPSDMNNLIRQSVDLFITGEAHEWNRELFREAGINFIAGGHYHTECFGIKSLMEKIKVDLKDITPVWLELENEI